MKDDCILRTSITMSKSSAVAAKREHRGVPEKCNAKMHAFTEGTLRHKGFGKFVQTRAHARPVEAAGGIAAWGRFIRVLAPKGGP